VVQILKDKGIETKLEPKLDSKVDGDSEINKIVDEVLPIDESITKDKEELVIKEEEAKIQLEKLIEEQKSEPTTP
jgi:hypothetical protein